MKTRFLTAVSLVFLGVFVNPCAFAQDKIATDLKPAEVEATNKAAMPDVVEAEEKVTPSFRSTKLELPRWASLAGERANVRMGPGENYPIKFVYHKKGLPVEIVQEFDNWRKIRDFEGEEGWVKQTLLSGNRFVMIKSDDLIHMRSAPDKQSRLVSRIEPRVIAALDRCDDAFCRISVGGYKGWVERNLLIGIYAGEKLD
jgi:SH3-like domain-containing protein